MRQHRPKTYQGIYIVLGRLFGVEKTDLRFGLQIFNNLDLSHFSKVIVTISGSLGTYRKKSVYGFMTVKYHNKEFRDVVVNMSPR